MLSGGKGISLSRAAQVKPYLLTKVLKQRERHKQVTWLQFQSPRQVRGAVLPMSVHWKFDLEMLGSLMPKALPTRQKWK